jgi:hypothetical protein
MGPLTNEKTVDIILLKAEELINFLLHPLIIFSLER